MICKQLKQGIMVLTDTQKKIVSFFIKEKLQRIFNDRQEIENAHDVLLDDVVNDIEETADWSFLTMENNEVVNSDVEISIARALYKKIVDLA
jgi:hypothetical protein